MFLDAWDVRLEISVASTHVNLNGLSVHVKNRKMENRSVHCFCNGENVRKKKIAKHRQMMKFKFCHFHLTHNIFNYCMRRFFFGLVYISVVK